MSDEFNKRKFMVAKVEFVIAGFKNPEEADKFAHFLGSIINAMHDLHIVDASLGIGVGIHRDDIAEIEPDGKPILKDGSTIEDVFKDIIKGQNNNNNNGLENNKPDWNKYKN